MPPSPLHLPSTLAARSCSWRIVPPPRNIAESRSILRLLQGFGDVGVFKWFKYEPNIGGENSGLVVWREAEAARRAIDASPVLGWLEGEKRRGVGMSGFLQEETGKMHEVDSTQEESDMMDASVEVAQDSEPRRRIKGAAELSSPSVLLREIQERRNQPTRHPSDREQEKRAVRSSPPILPSREFKLILEPWRGTHRDFIERTKFWNGFEIARQNPIQNDLERKVPLKGLSDVYLQRREGGQVMSRMISKEQAWVNSRPRLKEWVEERERNKKNGASMHRRDVSS